MKHLFSWGILPIILAGIITCVSCSPIVAEYTYRGTATNATIGGRQTYQLQFKEYEDGTLSGSAQLLTSTYSSIKSFDGQTDSIRGHIQGNRIEFRFTPHQIGQSNASAKVASFFDAISDGHTTYQGRFSNNRRNISGQWNAKISDTQYRGNAPQYQRGSFSFHLISKINHKTGKKTRTSSSRGKSTPSASSSEPANDTAMPTITVESDGGNTSAPPQPISFTVE